MSSAIPEDQESTIIKSESVYSGRVNFNKKKEHSYLILWAIAIALILLYIYSVQPDPIPANPQPTPKEKEYIIKVDQLNNKIAQLQQKQKDALSKLIALNTSLNEHIQQQKNIREQAAIQKINNNKISTISVGQCKSISQSQIPDAYKPDKRPSDKPKPSYLTPELEAISEFRTQSCGNQVMSATDTSAITFLTTKQGKTIDQVLYPTEELRNQRVQFYNKRLKFMTGKQNFQSLTLIKYNLKIDKSLDQQQARVEREQYDRITPIHKLHDYKTEIPMCVVVPSYNNNAKFRIQYNLNSIFTQNYSNYFVVVINDVSTDGSDQIYRKYFDFYNISKKLYAYRQNFVRRTALENIYIATHYYCSQDSVVLNMDGDDEFIGKNVLKIFNAGYQRLQSGVLYSNFYWYDQQRTINIGFTSEYTDAEKMSNAYRQASQRFSHLRSYKTQLFRKIEAKDLQDNQGKFFRITYDFAIYFPLMELACTKVNKIEGHHYLYNINTGFNDYATDGAKQVAVDRTVRSGRKYSCDKDFQAKLKKSS